MKIINTLSGLIKDRKLAVFCGAGISYHSGLPLSNPLLQQLFAQIGLNEKEARTIFDAKLPFEGIAGVVAEATGSLGFTDGYQKGSPNTNHRLIAELANQGYLHLIVTTNFDTLIEQALEETGVPSERYQVFADEKEFIRIDWNTDKIIVVKIHGTIREKRKMAVTLKMIGQQQLTEERNRIIEQLFKEGRALLFLGYSFSDSFDLSPQIRLLGNRESEVYIIAHETCRLAPVKSRANKKAHYPFAGFPNAYEIKMDTDELVRLLSIAVLGSPPMPEKTKTIQWQIMLKRWFESRGLTNAALFDGIAGRLFYLATKYHVAELKYKAALSLASTAEQRCDQLRNLGIVYKELGDYKTALTFLHDAEKLTPGFTNKKLEASILNNIAYTYGAEKNYRKALDYQTRAMKMARKIRNKELLAINYNNLGILQGAMEEPGKAMTSFNKGLKIMNQIGLIQWIPRTTNNIGIATRLLGDPKEAICIHEKVLALAEPLGFKDERLLAHQNLARCYRSLKSFDKAVMEARKAIILAKDSGKKDSLRKCLKLLADIYTDMDEKK